jgi:hypothetical protein
MADEVTASIKIYSINNQKKVQGNAGYFPELVV